MEVDRRFLWDYRFSPEELETEAFRRWYLGRVLVQGTREDLRKIGFETIYEYLPSLTLPLAVREFWEWYFGLPRVRPLYEHLDRKPDQGFASPVPSPFVRR